MSDKVFQWSLTAVTILVLIWVVAGIVFWFLPTFLTLLGAIIVEFGAAVILLHYWGKNYMNRRF